MAGLTILERAKFPTQKVPGMRVQIVERASDEFPFLHDTMIAPLGGRLFMAWYSCTEAEIVGRTVIRGRWSSDNGRTWSAPEILCEDAEGRHMVPVTFSEYEGEIWAYVTQMSAHDRPVGYVCARYEGSRWIVRERRSDLLLLNTLPQNVGNRWIAGGREADRIGELPLIPVVAIADREPCARWRTVRLVGSGRDDSLQYPETAVLVDGMAVDAIVRNEAGAMQAFESLDGGVHWSGPAECDMPIAPAKMYGGSLPDGRQYFLYNEATEDRARSRLVLAVRSGHGAPFERSWLLADGFDRALEAGPNWHYPCACIVDGWMQVSCTASDQSVRRNGALFSFPIDAIS